MKNDVKLLITDLDDTIWDWVSMWYKSFYPYFENILEVTGTNESALIDDFKNLHRKYGTSEVSYAFKELKSVNKNVYKKIELDNGNNKGILHQYYSDKKNNLKLFESVRETLAQIKSKGTRIIGFTESNIFYTKYRIKTLNLDGIFDVIYSPDDHLLPETVKRNYEKDYWESKQTRYVVLDRTFKKPDCQILVQILKDNFTSISDAIYIGDKLDRDIYMANQIGLSSIYAEYGSNIDNGAYSLLKKVTHWTDDEVKREIEFKKNIHDTRISPDYKISKFSELLNFFNFVDYRTTYNNDDKKNIIDIWKNVVEVQKHFNDIELRIRNFAITIFTFIFGGVGFSFKTTVPNDLFGLKHPIAVGLCLIGLVVLYAFYFMDRHWYHRLLQASVNKGMEIENGFMPFYPQIGLAGKIKQNSPLIFKFIPSMHSEVKIRLFYLILSFPFVIVAIVLSIM